MKTAVVIPALNEESNIGDLVHEIRNQLVDLIIVVDNGSNDNTAAKAKSNGATVIHETQRGYGFACFAGTKAALKDGAEIIAYMDADFSSPPHELVHLLSPLQQDQADLVLGSRVLGNIAPGSMLPHQRFGNWLSAKIMSQLYNVQVTDLGPFRAVRTDIIKSLAMQEMTFGWPTEMMVKVAKRNGRILEVPVSWNPRRNGQSKISGTIIGSILAGYFILGVTLRHAFK